MKMRQFLVCPYPQEVGLVPSWAAGVVRDEKNDKMVPAEAVACMLAENGNDLPAFFGPPITGEQRQSAWLSRSRVLLGQREPASPASAHRHPSQQGAAL